MPKKSASTPNGMICRVCGEDKPRYHFFLPRNKFNKDFFANGVPDGHTCFSCAGDYRCQGCGQVKPAAAFRLQGRYCADCRAAKRFKNAAVGSESPSITDLPALIDSIDVDLENGANWGFDW